MAAAVLILWAAYAAAKRERELIAMAADCELDIKQLRDSKRQVERERDARLPGLPTDALVLVTEQGYLCPNGLDHPAGSRGVAATAGEGAPPSCAECVKYLEHYDPS